MENARQDLINQKEAANILGVSCKTLEGWRYKRDYRLPFIKVGRLVKYSKKDIEKYLEQQKWGE